MGFELLHLATFTTQLKALPKERRVQVWEKLALLHTDPFPDGKVKKKLSGYKDELYRLRAGDYRIIYTFESDIVRLIGVDDRKDVYERLQPPSRPSITSTKQLAHLDSSLFEPLPTLDPSRAHNSDQDRRPRRMPVDYLPRQIDRPLLRRLDSPPQFDDALCACTTVDDLYAVEIPETLRNELFDVVTAPDYDEAMSQPYYVTGGIQNLQRFVDGELLGFLLKLSPEQEKAAYWSLNAQGPTLLRGGPGTGKTVVALYRVLAIVEACRAKGSREGAGSLRILFTTYTNALVSYCEQQLQQLLGPEAECVTVRTADSLVKEIVASTQAEWRPAHESVEKQALQRAMDGVQQSPAKYGLQRHVELRSISNLSSDYLLEEFGGVIDGRELESLEDYLDTPRAGRLVRLSKAQRTAIWDLYCAFCKEIALLKHSTWHQLRRRAAEIARSVGSDVERFDAVVVDEAQDLDPAVLRLIVALCKAPNRVFLAADMNQSIYSGGFRWTDIHADLRFRGRAITLWVNQRSTREIGEASYSYLRGGALEDLDRNRLYVLSGQKPILWHATPEDEVRGLGAFLHDAARDWRLGLGNCALLVPTHSVGQELAKQLRERNIPAQFMTSRELSLSKPVVKVLPLKSAKGLEFPIVAIAGFREAQAASREYDADEREERAGYDRRALFVAMTRAMRALLIVIPPGASVPNLRGFDDSLWDIRRGT